MSSFDPRLPGFWDEGELRAEQDRVFDICQACRRCTDLCPSFTSLFNAVDAQGADPNVERLSPLQRDRVADLCYQCKLCEEACPYTAPHPFELDFPQLVLRVRAVRARRDGVAFGDRLLGDRDACGRAGVRLAPLANWAQRSRLGRAALESIGGVDRRQQLPMFAQQSFDEWFVTRRPAPVTEPRRKVALFTTCYVNHHAPQIGRALVRVLERSGCAVELPRQRCCGMPAMEAGDLERAMAWADQNTASLAAAIEGGADVVIPGPSCSYVLRHDYPDLCSDSGRARSVAERSFDASTFLLDLHRRGELDTSFARIPGRIAYHVPCHVRALPTGGDARDLLTILGAELTVVERCAGMGSTWGRRPANHDRSRQIAGPLVDELTAAATDAVVSDCPQAAQQIEQMGGPAPLHPIELLAAAYGDEPTPA